MSMRRTFCITCLCMVLVCCFAKPSVVKADPKLSMYGDINHLGGVCMDGGLNVSKHLRLSVPVELRGKIFNVQVEVQSQPVYRKLIVYAKARYTLGSMEWDMPNQTRVSIGLRSDLELSPYLEYMKNLDYGGQGFCMGLKVKLF
ncbi:MAG: hypothetical protein KAS32_25550 [Candidatus Peribacteraceae bacterium]|nr:hypothetical protein [Candidatus Peribacteraceae bacterium]